MCGKYLVCLLLWTHYSPFWSLQKGWLVGTTPTSSLALWLNQGRETEVNSWLLPVMSPLWPSTKSHCSSLGVLLYMILSFQVLGIPPSLCPFGPRSGNSPAGVHPVSHYALYFHSPCTPSRGGLSQIILFPILHLTEALPDTEYNRIWFSNSIWEFLPFDRRISQW